MNMNPNKLEVGKSYWFRYKPANGSRWFKAEITRFTEMGHAWMESRSDNCSGICSQDSYEIVKCTLEKELEEKAREFLKDKGYNVSPMETALPKWFAEFYNEISPGFEKEIIDKKTTTIEIQEYKDTGLGDNAHDLGLFEEISKIFQYGEYLNATIVVDEDLNVIGGKIHRYEK